MKVREDTGTYVIEEHAGPMVGECRFALDRREPGTDGVTRLINIGWYRTYRGAMNALSMERGSTPAPCPRCHGTKEIGSEITYGDGWAVAVDRKSEPCPECVS